MLAKIDPFSLDEATNATSYEVVARHGCESDLDKFPNHEHRPFCSEYNNKCYEYEDSTLPNATDSVTITRIETCFCDSDRWLNKNCQFTNNAWLCQVQRCGSDLYSGYNSWGTDYDNNFRSK